MATDVDDGGGGAEDKGDGGVGGALLLPLLLPVEEDVHRFDDDMATRRDGQAS